MTTRTAVSQPYHITDDGGLSLDFHPGQWRAWDSMARFVFVTAGTQGGKTSFGPFWQHREIYHPVIGRGGGDHLAVSGSYDLFQLKMLPAMRELFEHITRDGRFWASNRVIELRDPNPKSKEHPKGGTFWANRADDKMWGRIILRSAESGGGLESSTALSAWLDECGMDTFTAETWRAIRRRLSLSRGRVLGTTTLYVMYNWLKQLYDEWVNGRKDIDFIQFASIQNPAFPKEEYDQALAEMPEHVINMQYRGLFDNPPGMILGDFNTKTQVIKPFNVPGNWKSVGGMDYGGVNTCCGRFRIDPIGNGVYLTDEYLEGNKTAQEHANGLQWWGIGSWVGGSWSEGQWRREFRAAGLPVQRPRISSVWEGINHMISFMKSDRLFVFDTCEGFLGQASTYARKMDKATGLPTDEILNKKQYHYIDMARYGLSQISRGDYSSGSTRYT